MKIKFAAFAIAAIGLATMWALAADGDGGKSAEAASAPVTSQASAATSQSSGDEKDKEKKDSLKKQQAIIKAVKPSLATVEYTLQHDKGERPSRGSAYIDEERPMEVIGYFLSPTKVICVDSSIHPRFIKSIAVRAGQQLIDAKIAGYCIDQPAMMLELATPAKDVTPLTFDEKAKAPYYTIKCSDNHNGLWMMSADSVSFEFMSNLLTKKDCTVASVGGLLTDSAGVPVGMSYIMEFPLDDSWKGSPEKWKVIGSDGMTKMLSDIEKTCNNGIVRAALSFRSPKKDQSSSRSYYSGDEGGDTERNLSGIIIDDKTVLILANMAAKVTARLERIKIFTADGKSATAKFKATLKDYGAFLATLDAPLGQPVKIDTAAITNFENAMVLSADVRIQGETRTSYYKRARIYSFEVGWKKNIYPSIYSGVGDYTFTCDGKLLAIDVSRRRKISDDNRYGGRDSNATPMSMLSAAIADLKNSIDPNNIPLSEEEECRIAWLGVELQAMDTELARINNVSDVTGDGRTGAMVSYVYPGSPADKAGLVAGDIILRVHSPEVPKPIDLDIADSSGREFDWKGYDDMPERYFDRLPTPWPSVQNTLNKILTDIGFGKKFTLDIVHDGKAASKGFEVVQSPSYYDSAAKFKSEPLGLTVKDMTYEVRRYFQKNADDPGVIVAKIEPGSKISVAGLKPYEIITHVNDKPVKTVKEFADAVAAYGGREMRFQVLRMTQGRVVKVKAGDAASQPTSEPAGEPTTAPATTPAAEDVKTPASRPVIKRPATSDDEDE